MFRLFNEDSGDLGSLPVFQHSTSKPFHPQEGYRKSIQADSSSQPKYYPAASKACALLGDRNAHGTRTNNHQGRGDDIGIELCSSVAMKLTDCEFE